MTEQETIAAEQLKNEFEATLAQWNAPDDAENVVRIASDELHPLVKHFIDEMYEMLHS